MKEQIVTVLFWQKNYNNEERGSFWVLESRGGNWKNVNEFNEFQQLLLSQ